jgi:hypothetical protein
MYIEDLKENLKLVNELRDELKVLKKEARRGYTLHEYIDLIQERLWNDHGERDRFAEPKRLANFKLDELRDINKEQFNSAFSKNKTKLLSILNRYIKDLQIGFQESD